MLSSIALVCWLSAVVVAARTLPQVAGPTSHPTADTTNWPNTKPDDKCTPFDPTVYNHRDMDAFCAHLNSLSDKELFALHANAHIPQQSDGFPLRGCAVRCIAGNSFAAVVAKDPHNNLGWGGKCFDWTFNTTTGTPRYLDNVFSPEYDTATLPNSERLKGKLACRAAVSWQPVSSGDGKPAYVFDHALSDNIYAEKMKKWLDVRAFRDEMRLVRPGFMLGRIFLTTGPGTVEEMPIFFALFQSCTAAGTFAVTPEQRALPLLSAK